MKNMNNNPNFTITAESESKTDYGIEMELEYNVRDLAHLDTDTIIADLERLADKHPEMFKKPSDVFRLIREIKTNPTFFYRNNRLDASLIVKRLNDEKIGKLVIKKSNNEVIHATRVDESDLKRLEKVSKTREKESSALSKLSSDKVANELETQLGLPSETISETNSTIKELESQVQKLTQITIDTARNFPQDTALLVYAYDKCGENALANTLINTISADKEAMQSVQREFENLIQQESEQSTQSVDEVAQTQQELDEAQILQQGDDSTQMILGDEVNDGPKGPRQTF